jgi:hypothetical protein
MKKHLNSILGTPVVLNYYYGMGKGTKTYEGVLMGHITVEAQNNNETYIIYSVNGESFCEGQVCEIQKVVGVNYIHIS